MKSWLKASLKLAGLSFVSGSIIFLFWYLAYTSSVKSHVESVCSSIAPYLQIGSYRWAEDLANGSLSGSYPELIVQISQSGNSRAKDGQARPFVEVRCEVPGLSDSEFRIALQKSNGFGIWIARKLVIFKLPKGIVNA